MPIANSLLLDSVCAGDVIEFSNGAITSGTPNFTTSTGIFAAGDVGKSIQVNGAGTAGAGNVLNTTITAFVNANAVTLGANASATVSGATGFFGTDDTSAITGALATGIRTIISTAGRIYLTNGGHTIATDGQMIVGRGTFKKKATTAQAIFTVSDHVQSNQFDIVGDGNRIAFTGGNAGSCIFAARAIGMRIDGEYHSFIDDGVKTWNCPNIDVAPTAYFHDIYNIGVEMRSYRFDPRTGSAWSGPVEAPSGRVYGTYERITDESAGAQNGTGVDFSEIDNSSGVGSPLPIHDLTVGGTYRDCLRCIWTENNDAGGEASCTLDNPYMEGGVSGSIDTYCGIGLVGVRRANVISPRGRNIGSFGLPTGSVSAFLIVSNGVGTSEFIDVISPQFIDDTGAVATFSDGAITSGDATFTTTATTFTAGDVGSWIVVNGAGPANTPLMTAIASFTNANSVELANNASTTVSSASGSYGTATQYGILGTAGDNITISGGSITGCGLAQIQNNGITNFSAERVLGAEGKYSWGNIVRLDFWIAATPSSTTTTLLPSGWGNDPEITLGVSGKLVGVSARLSAVITGGTFEIRPSSASTVRSNLIVTRSDFGGGARFSRTISSEDAVLVGDTAAYGVSIATNGSFTPTSLGAYVTLLVDTSV
jgi:hypothetical protein